MITAIMSAAGSAAADAVRMGPGTTAPPSFNEDPSLFLFNLFIIKYDRTVGTDRRNPHLHQLGYFLIS